QQAVRSARLVLHEFRQQLSDFTARMPQARSEGSSDSALGHAFRDSFHHCHRSKESPMGTATSARQEAFLVKPTAPHEHRAKAKRKAAEVRRRIADVQAEQAALRLGRVELEKFLAAAPALSWRETVEKARYLLTILS